MPFFFAEIKKKKEKTEGLSVETLHKLECHACPLNKAAVLSPKMEPSGTETPNVYVLGEGPGRVEDSAGEPFVGLSGKLLKTTFQQCIAEADHDDWDNFVDIDEQVKEFIRFNNTVRNRPTTDKGGNRAPTWVEIECCRPSVVRDIEKTKPKIIVGTGAIPLNWVLGKTTLCKKISQWRGRRFPVKIGSHVCWFFPILHPAYILRKRTIHDKGGFELRTENERMFALDIEEVWKAIGEEYELPTANVEEPEDFYKGITIVDGSGGRRDIETVRSWLIKFSTYKSVALDIETNALKPYGKDSKILTISIGTYKETIAFPLWHKGSKWNRDETLEVKNILEEFIRLPNVAKIVQNLTFEQEWLSYFYKNNIIRCTKWHDTMAQAFLIDSRKEMLNLNALTKIHLGFEIKEQSKINIKDLDNEDLGDVLKYNALDTKYTERIFHIQKLIVEECGLVDIYYEQIRRTATITLTQLKGLNVDQNVVQKHKTRLTDELKELHKNIMAMDCVIEYEEKTSKDFNPKSITQAGFILDEILGFGEQIELKEVVYTDGVRDETRKLLTSESILKTINHKFPRTILRIRTATKSLSTYVLPLEEDGGKFLFYDKKLHPSYNANFAATRRLSSSNPNAQNFPSRKDRSIRSQIVAPKGHVMVAADYGQIEARVLAMDSGDEFLIKAFREDYDIHIEWARRLAEIHPQRIGGRRYLDDKDVMKRFRSDVKNQFVFPLFYGAWVGSVSKNSDIPIGKIDKVASEFWETFTGVKKWQEERDKFYLKHHYLESKTGFKYWAPLDKNQRFNYQIQGAASDIVIDAMNRLSERGEEEDKPQYQAVMNIHDDLTFYLPKKTLEKDLEVIITEMLDCKFDFINIPLTVEVSMGPNWYNLKEIGTYRSDKWCSDETITH